MKLFHELERTYDGIATLAEPHFHYLNRSSRNEVNEIRKVLESWFERFPEHAKSDVRARFRKSDDGSYYGAFTELYCHAYCTGFGLAPRGHPHIEGVRQTDFSLFKSDTFFSFLECTVATEFREGAAKRERTNQIYDVLNRRLNSPKFFLKVDVLRYPERSMNVGRIIRFLEEKLEGLDPDVVSTALQNIDNVFDSEYYWIYEEDEFAVAFTPIPKPPEARGVEGLRPLGMFTSGGQFAHVVDDRTPILDALELKAKRYGVLNAPYIIAINGIEEGIANFDITGAIFGEEQIVIGSTISDRRKGRAPNGFWQGRRGPRNKRVSGVLMMTDIDPWTVAQKIPVLWHNPWADFPIDPASWAGTQQIPDPTTQTTKLQEGLPIATILGLHPDWPRMITSHTS